MTSQPFLFDKFTLAFVTVVSLVVLAAILAFLPNGSELIPNVVTAIVSIISFIFLYHSNPPAPPSLPSKI